MGTVLANSIKSQVQSNGMLWQPHCFANPDLASGTIQAQQCDNLGAHFTCDGMSLPATLLMQEKIGTTLVFGQTLPGSDVCFNQSPAQLQQYMVDFYNEYRRLNGCPPTIYTDMAWWCTCTGGTVANGACTGGYSGLDTMFNANLQVSNAADPNLQCCTIPANRINPFGWSRATTWAFQRRTALLPVSNTNGGAVLGVPGSLNTDTVLELVYQGGQQCNCATDGRS